MLQNIHKSKGWYPLFWLYVIESDVSGLANGCFEARARLRRDATVALMVDFDLYAE